MTSASCSSASERGVRDRETDEGFGDRVSLRQSARGQWEVAVVDEAIGLGRACCGVAVAMLCAPIFVLLFVLEARELELLEDEHEEDLREVLG